MNAEAGVPVGDTTLLAKLREVEQQSAYWNELPHDTLAAVITLIDAAQPFSDRVTCLEEDCPHKVCVLNRALAPFVGEATQSDG